MKHDLDQEMLRAVELDDARDDRLATPSEDVVEELLGLIEIQDEVLSAKIQLANLRAEVATQKIERKVAVLEDSLAKESDRAWTLLFYFWEQLFLIGESVQRRITREELIQRMRAANLKMTLAFADSPICDQWTDFFNAKVKEAGLDCPDFPPADDVEQ